MTRSPLVDPQPGDMVRVPGLDVYVVGLDHGGVSFDKEAHP